MSGGGWSFKSVAFAGNPDDAIVVFDDQERAVASVARYGCDFEDEAAGIADSKLNAARIVACVNACQGINPEALPLLVKALDAMMTVQSKRRHPLGQPDEGIAYAAADAMAKSREAMKALGLPS